MLVTIVALCAGWIVDRSREPKILYLHVYGWHYPQNYDAIEFVPTHANNTASEEWYTRLVTIAISSDVPFHVDAIVVTEDYHAVSLSKLSRPATAENYDEGPVEYVDEPLPNKQR